MLGSGNGGYSAVFKLQRDEAFTETSCLRIINIIQKNGQFTRLTPKDKEAYCVELAAAKKTDWSRDGPHLPKTTGQAYF